MLAGFLVGGFYFLAKILYELPKESKESFLKFNWLREWLNYSVSLYIVIIIVLILLIITRLEKSRLKVKLMPVNNKTFLNTPINDYENYNTDTFGVRKTRWKWSYKWDVLRDVFIIQNLKPCCNVCGSVMELQRSRYSSDSAVCSKCRLDGKDGYKHVDENLEDVEKEIIRRIQNNEVPI